MATVEDLQKTIATLREQLENERKELSEIKGCVKRERIDKMSSEVVDSNPYRYS